MAYSATPKKRNVTRSKFKVMSDHDEFLSRIKKTLYYGKLPMTERFSLPVSELAAELFSEVKCGKSLQRLSLEEAATMSQHACVSPCSLVLALLYLERLKSCNSDYLQRVAPSELFLISMMVASKFLHDDGEEDEVFNYKWAIIAGLDVKDMNRSERDFLQAIEWEVFVTEQAFWTRLRGLEKDVALKEGKRRGWFSYTDLDNLFESLDLASVAQAVICVSAVCLTSYTASVLTLIGSAFIASHIPGSSMNPSMSTSVTPISTPPEILLDTLSSDSSPMPTPPVDILTTSFILASLSSSNHSRELLHCDHVRKQISNDNSYKHFVQNETYITLDLSEWTVEYVGWQWWQNELISLISFYTKANTSDRKEYAVSGTFQEPTIANLFASEQAFEIIDGVSSLNEGTNGVSQEPYEWSSLVHNWFDQAMLEKRRQTKFLPIEVSSSY